jgi:outer membrane beta-barrel protein
MTSGSTPSSTDSGNGETPTTGPKTATSTAAQPSTEAPSFKLIGGAPLGDPDVNVHIVEKKVLSDYRRSEVVLFPVVGQINGKFTNHLGAAAEYLYHFQENVAFQVTPSFFYLNGESSFNEDLVNIARLQAQAATALTMVWGAEAGVEATPIYGKFAFYETRMAHFALVLNAGVGITQTRVQLRPSSDQGPATYGDTGFKFLGNVGGGFRVKFGEHWVVRLEVRDLIYTASVNSINGCNEDDLTALAGGADAQSSGCNAQKFADGDIPLAKALIKTPSSDVLNQVEFYGGVAYVF